MTTLAYVILGIIIGGLLILVLLFKSAWRVAEPDEALIISGFRTSQSRDGVGENMGFRIVTGGDVSWRRAARPSRYIHGYSRGREYMHLRNGRLCVAAYIIQE